MAWMTPRRARFAHLADPASPGWPDRVYDVGQPTCSAWTAAPAVGLPPACQPPVTALGIAPPSTVQRCPPHGHQPGSLTGGRGGTRSCSLARMGAASGLCSTLQAHRCPADGATIGDLDLLELRPAGSGVAGQPYGDRVAGWIRGWRPAAERRVAPPLSSHPRSTCALSWSGCRDEPGTSCS